MPLAILLAVIVPMQRLISIAILIGWLAPSAAALGIWVHLTAEHHGPHAVEHEAELTDWLRAAVHGHHHDLEARDHEHDVRLSAQAPALRPDLDLPAVSPTGASRSTDVAQAGALDRHLMRGPPREFFGVHCVLLI